MGKAKAAVIGSGNIGTDLVFKLLRSDCIEPRWLVGIDPQSEGLRRARELGLQTGVEGPGPLLEGAERPELIFEATSAAVHREHAPAYAAAGIVAIDLTPAAIGPYVVPPVNLDEHKEEMNLNLVTCGGQATVPLVHAVARVARVEYAEIVASVSSASAGPGTRANIDEFTRTTARALEVIGGARRGKAIIVLNPADPPMIMRDTIFCSLPSGADRSAVTASIQEMLEQVRAYVPGYRLTAEPQFAEDRVEIFAEVEGAGDFLPPYAGNLDIMTAAATRVGEHVARTRLGAG